MKILMSFLFLSFFAFGQTERIIEFADVDAEFPGGAAAMRKWINDNLEFPSACAEINAQGRVYVKFCVEKDGSLTNVIVERNQTGCEDFVKEVKRVISIMPKWAPGEVSGKACRSFVRYPFNFISSN